MDCLFCKIAAGEIPCNKVYEDDRILAFHDISPQAPVHVLVIPKEHIGGIDEITQDNIGAVSCVLQEIPQIAGQLGLAGGYRVISNVGADGCQSVRHLHFHILGGKQLSEKMS